MFKCKCGCSKFFAHQLVRIEIIVNGNNRFLENVSEDNSTAIYDSETPYGPYTCVSCEAEYDKFEEVASEEPYLKEFEVKEKYNPNYGDDKICTCDHSYYRHFDSYEGMAPVGCKYCSCPKFTERIEGNIDYKNTCFLCGKDIEDEKPFLCKACENKAEE